MPQVDAPLHVRLLGSVLGRGWRENREAAVIRKMNAEHEGGCHTHLGYGPQPACPRCSS